MPDEYLERERKFDVPVDFELPNLPNARRETHRLRATYYDTDDALLQARGVTLRRRVGGSDDGWHVKIPHPDGRLEIRTDGAPARPPREFTALIRGLRFDRPLHRRAVLQTTRDAYQLHTPEGQLVAEVADDQVQATVGSTGESLQWREIEVEVGPAGNTDSLEHVAEMLTAVGATPSQYPSKFARAVGERPERPQLAGVARLVDDYLQTQYQRITLGDLRMRRGENAVHKTRVAVRRTRSTLRVFGSLFDEDRASRLDRELSWYAETLGRVRDLDIARRRIESDLALDPDGLIAEESAAGLLRILDSQRRAAWEAVQSTLEGRRYGALLHQLDEWRCEAPWLGGAGADVTVFVKRAQKKSDKRLSRATTDASAPDSDFHRARKAAKRTRYAAELAQPQMGKRAKRIVKAHEKQQEVLGELQDHVMVIATLRDIADSRPTSSRIGFVCGILAQRHVEAKVEARRRPV